MHAVGAASRSDARKIEVAFGRDHQRRAVLLDGAAAALTALIKERSSATAKRAITAATSPAAHASASGARKRATSSQHGA